VANRKTRKAGVKRRSATQITDEGVMKFVPKSCGYGKHKPIEAHAYGVEIWKLAGGKNAYVMCRKCKYILFDEGVK
jgi:hypothetical protein